MSAASPLSVIGQVEQPRELPTERVDRGPLLGLPEIILSRRATQTFSPGPVPKRYLDAILQLATQAPSADNLQVWRYLVLQDAESKARLRRVAMDQPKLTEAPVVIVALGAKHGWEPSEDAVFDETFRRGAFPPEMRELYGRMARQAYGYFDRSVWVTRSAMIGVSFMMLAAEAYGFQTAPLEGCDPIALAKEFDLPDDIEFVCLLCIGRRAGPMKPYSGRFPVETVAFAERYGEPYRLDSEAL